MQYALMYSIVENRRPASVMRMGTKFTGSMSRHVGHTIEIAELFCPAKIAHLCRLQALDEILLFYAGGMQIEVQRRDESISQQHDLEL
jgi:hypothetical protein